MLQLLGRELPVLARVRDNGAVKSPNEFCETTQVAALPSSSCCSPGRVGIGFSFSSQIFGACHTGCYRVCLPDVDFGGGFGRPFVTSALPVAL
ncbi:unnamed protein product [Lampetra fluviatilis]